MKAVLVIDMPKSCEDCELCLDDYFCLRLGEVDESVEYGTKDLRCPLKQLPDWQKVKPSTGGYTRGFTAGFNKFRFLITGEKEC